MKLGKLITINIIVILLLGGLGFGGYYYYYQRDNFIKTEDAKVMGDFVPVASEVSGKLTTWNVDLGKKVEEGKEMGVVTMGNQHLSVLAPTTGTIVQNKIGKGQLIAAGQPLAQIVNLDKLYVTANIDETNIKDVAIGQKVDITLDIDPNAKITGTVKQIGLATNSIFSLIPSPNATGNYTKVTQQVPVKIELNEKITGIVPGINATVKIHK